MEKYDFVRLVTVMELRKDLNAKGWGKITVGLKSCYITYEVGKTILFVILFIYIEL
jgi:hypothetical protein